MKSVLFITPKYFDYYKKIKKILSQKSYEVNILFDNKKDKKKLKKYLSNNYDVLFVIKGENYFPEDYDSVKANKKILYEWDSVRNFNYLSLLEHFDITLTFDYKDAQEYKLQYLPLFFSKIKKNQKKEIDYLFVGIWHSDRAYVLEKLKNNLSLQGYKCKFYLYYPWYYMLFFLLTRKIRYSSFLTVKKLSQKRLYHLYSISRAVIDIAHPDQTGFTMRTMETLGNNIKLVTSNRNIQSADFYNKNNIFIFDRNNPVIDSNFLDLDFFPISIEKFEISHWVDTILSY